MCRCQRSLRKAHSAGPTGRDASGRNVHQDDDDASREVAVAVGLEKPRCCDKGGARGKQLQHGICARRFSGAYATTLLNTTSSLIKSAIFRILFTVRSDTRRETERAVQIPQSVRCIIGALLPHASIPQHGNVAPLRTSQ